MPLGRNQSRFAPCLCVTTMPVAPLRAPSALVGKWSEHVGPKWTPGREQALSTVIVLPISSLKCSCWRRFFLIFFFLLSFLALLHLPVRGLVSCFSPGGRVLGELGFCELEKECTSVWSALISVEKDLIVPGFWDHYLSFSFIKSVMRKFKIKGFVNWIPVWKGGTYQEVSTEACRWATGNNTRLEHLSLAAFDKDPVPRQGGGVVCGKASGYPEIFSSVNNIFPPLAGYLHLDLQQLLKRKGGLLAESLPRAVRPDSAEMQAGKSFHLLVVLLLICKEEELVLLLIFFFF